MLIVGEPMRRLFFIVAVCLALAGCPLILTGCNQNAAQAVDTGYDVSEQMAMGGVTLNVDPSWEFSDGEGGFWTASLDGDMLDDGYVTHLSIATTMNGQMVDPVQGLKDLWGSTAEKVQVEVTDEWEQDGIDYSKAEINAADEGNGRYRMLFGCDTDTGHGFLLYLGCISDGIPGEWSDERMDALFDEITDGLTYDPNGTTSDYIVYRFGNTSSTGEGETKSQQGIFASVTLANLGEFEPTTITGNGDDVVEVPSAGMPHLMTITHSGSRNFAVHTVNSAGDDVDLLVNTIGNYSGTVTDYQDFKDVSMLSISADGAWSITFAPLSSMNPLANGGQNTGDNVLYIDEDSLMKLHITNSGESNFSVWAVGMSDYDLLVNEIGNYDGTVIWSEPQSFLIVSSKGTWTVDW